ncbi:MAG: hypothetical protein ACKO0M_11950 [Cyanobium sp.]
MGRACSGFDLAQGYGPDSPCEQALGGLTQRLGMLMALISDQLRQPDLQLCELMGDCLDAAKTLSSLTLFAAAGLPSTQNLLDQLGGPCRATQQQLDR